MTIEDAVVDLTKVEKNLSDVAIKVEVRAI